MVARVNNPLGGLVVSFHRDGQEIDHAVARDGARALKMSLLMLAKLDELQDGDILKCKEEDTNG